MPGRVEKGFKPINKGGGGLLRWMLAATKREGGIRGRSDSSHCFRSRQLLQFVAVLRFKARQNSYVAGLLRLTG